MATKQLPKTRIDTGVRGSPSTGDILYDGGNYLNTNFNSVYNTFGDQRLFDQGIEGADHQILHATGYYQKNSPGDYTSQAVEIGSMHDISIVGDQQVILPKGKKGEGVVFVNFDGSISQKARLVINCNTADSINGAGKTLIVTTPNVRIELWGSSVNASTSAVTWNYKITSLYGQAQNPIDKNFLITGNGATFAIGHSSQYKAIKLLTSSEINSPGPGADKFKSSEILLHVDTINKKVWSTEYAVIKNKEDFYTTAYAIDATSGQVTMTVKPNAQATIRFSVKAISTTAMTADAENPGA